jgi:glutamyl-tRNA reductase
MDSSGHAQHPVSPLTLVGLEFSLRTVTLDQLEAVSRTVTLSQVRDWFSLAVGTEEVVLLSTCHRVELALLLRTQESLAPWRAVLPGEPDAWCLREGAEAVHHLFRVAAGRESLAVGEAEARQQVRLAGGRAQSRHPRPVLRELFLEAADAADEICPIVPSSQSIASIAASRVLEALDQTLPRILIVGSGTMGRQLAERLADSAHLTIVYHQRPPEEDFLRAVGARSLPLQGLASELPSFDAIITAAKFGTHGLTSADLPLNHPLLLVDLGVPRNIDPAVRELPNIRLIDLQELHGGVTRSPSPDSVDPRVEDKARESSDRLARLLLEPWVDAVRRAAEEVRRAELAEARPHMGPLNPAQERAIERLTQRLVARLLLSPTERIRELPTGPQGDVQRRLAMDLLSPQPTDP